MSKSRIKVSRDLTRPVEVAPAPFESARRWRSVHEDEASQDRLTIFMTQEAYRQVNVHAGSDFGREVGGMLVGQARQSPEGELYVVVEAHLPARHVSHGPAHLTLTSDTLVDALNRLEAYPNKRIVGWYHTHPGLSVFLSSRDVWLHTHFFPQPWHVALVIDPQANQGGFFCYGSEQRSRLHPQRHVGFYELVEQGRETVVAWRNLLPGEIADTGVSNVQSEVIRDVPQ